MPWVLQADEQTLYLYANTPDSSSAVPTPRVVVIGRRDDCDITFKGASISRRHAEITVHPLQRSDLMDLSARPKVAIKDLGAKHRTQVNGVSLDPHVDRQLTAGDAIILGKEGCSLTLLFQPVVAATSTLSEPDRKQLETLLMAMGGHMQSNWNSTCTTLVMPGVKVTTKVIQALCACKHIVTTKWFEKALALAPAESLPDPTNFLPRLVDPNVKSDQASFEPNSERATVYKGRRFLFLNKSQFVRFGTLVQAAGGTPELYLKPKSAPSPKTHMELTSTVVKPSKSFKPEDHGDADWNEKVLRDLQSIDLRAIQDSQLSRGVLYVSAKKVDPAASQSQSLGPRAMGKVRRGPKPKEQDERVCVQPRRRSPSRSPSKSPSRSPCGSRSGSRSRSRSRSRSPMPPWIKSPRKNKGNDKGAAEDEVGARRGKRSRLPASPPPPATHDQTPKAVASAARSSRGQERHDDHDDGGNAIPCTRRQRGKRKQASTSPTPPLSAAYLKDTVDASVVEPEAAGGEAGGAASVDATGQPGSRHEAPDLAQVLVPETPLSTATPDEGDHDERGTRGRRRRRGDDDGGKVQVQARGRARSPAAVADRATADRAATAEPKRKRLRQTRTPHCSSDVSDHESDEDQGQAYGKTCRGREQQRAPPAPLTTRKSSLDLGGFRPDAFDAFFNDNPSPPPPSSKRKRKSRPASPERPVDAGEATDTRRLSSKRHQDASEGPRERDRRSHRGTTDTGNGRNESPSQGDPLVARQEGNVTVEIVDLVRRPYDKELAERQRASLSQDVPSSIHGTASSQGSSGRVNFKKFRKAYVAGRGRKTSSIRLEIDRGSQGRENEPWFAEAEAEKQRQEREYEAGEDLFNTSTDGIKKKRGRKVATKTATAKNATLRGFFSATTPTAAAASAPAAASASPRRKTARPKRR
eukprot:m.348525 g.348525  ORF g.348525 m.348525 type:complete len:923 (-) comp19877_c0_seq12:2230-4998(-)